MMMLPCCNMIRITSFPLTKGIPIHRMLIYNTFPFNFGEVMTTSDVKTALESEANAVIDALKLAFVG